MPEGTIAMKFPMIEAVVGEIVIRNLSDSRPSSVRLATVGCRCQVAFDTLEPR